MSKEAKGFSQPKDPIRLFYWDTKPNFGDQIGPWLVEAMTGRPTENVRGRKKGPALATVGSIIGMFDRPDLEVWGSGLMSELDDGTIARLQVNKPSCIHAVRGWYTWRELTKGLQWEVPKIFGDPALLLPRIYKPASNRDSTRIAVCPHFTHKGLVEHLQSDTMQIVDVQGGVRAAVDAIATSAVCLSSSLHGLIVAQAYGVPWVWVEFAGRKVGGSDFKFEDFFTVLNRKQVVHQTVPRELSGESLVHLAKEAALPTPLSDFDDLWNAFPNLA